MTDRLYTNIPVVMVHDLGSVDLGDSGTADRSHTFNFSAAIWAVLPTELSNQGFSLTDQEDAQALFGQLPSSTLSEGYDIPITIVDNTAYCEIMDNLYRTELSPYTSVKPSKIYATNTVTQEIVEGTSTDVVVMETDMSIERATYAPLQTEIYRFTGSYLNVASYYKLIGNNAFYWTNLNNSHFYIGM